MLRLKPSDLDAIAEDNQKNSSKCLLEMLKLWLKNTYEPRPAWSAIVQALEKIKEDRLAKDICKKYCTGIHKN